MVTALNRKDTGCQLFVDENQQKVFIQRDATFNETDFGSTKAQMKCSEYITECAQEETEIKGQDGATRNEQQDPSNEP